MSYILSVGAYGNDVRRLQEYLNTELSADLTPDGLFGGMTKTEVQRFRRKFGLPESPAFDDQCFAVSGARGFAAPAFDKDPAKQGQDWPRKPQGLTSASAAQMQSKAGKIEFNWTPQPNNPEHISITNDYVAAHLTQVFVPELKNSVIPLDPGVTRTDGRITFHKAHAARLQKLFADWGKAGLTDRLLTYDGAFNARLKRGFSGNDASSLSNHAWGTAFDVNASWNPLGHTPKLLGARGCVRELVEIAAANGFYWGGFFTRQDGMHFEVAAEAL